MGTLNGNSTERVGHLTQKPAELIRRFVKALSFEGAIVLDFFAGSGTTGRVCIEERRHSLLVDSDSKLHRYLDKHIDQIKSNLFLPEFSLIKDSSIHAVLDEIAYANQQLKQNSITKDRSNE